MDSAGEGSRAKSLRRGFSSEGDCDAESAAIYARGDKGPFAPHKGDCSQWDYESERLIEWARQKGKLRDEFDLNPLLADTRGAEQLVYTTEIDRVYKFFYTDERLPENRRMVNGMFGWIDGEEVKTRPASPSEAMARIAWFNRLYPEAKITIEGIDVKGRIRTSQPYVGGRTPSSFRDMEEALKNAGWEPYYVTPHDPGTSTFFNKEAEAYLTDVHEHNGKILTDQYGQKRFQPFDVVPIVPP